jgi:hypothetical protein
MADSFVMTEISDGKQQRIFWKPEERRALIEKGAQLLNERPSLSPVEIVRHAMNVLPEARRRHVISLQAFQREFAAMRKLAEMGPIHTTQESEHPSNPVTPPASDVSSIPEVQAKPSPAPGQELSIGSRAIAEALDFFVGHVKEQLAATAVPTREPIEPSDLTVIRSELQAVSDRVSKMEAILVLMAKEFGVSLPADLGALPQSSLPSTTAAEPSPATKRGQARCGEPSPEVRSKISILIIGAKGQQAQHLKDEFLNDRVELKFAEAGSGKSLRAAANNIIIWGDFISHRDTNANPNATIVKGGLSSLKSAIREMVQAQESGK